jgi:hypothetical protein
MNMTKALLVSICMAMTLFAHAEKETPFMFSIWPSKYTQFLGDDSYKKNHGDNCSVYGFRLAPGCGVAKNVYGLDVGCLTFLHETMNGLHVGGLAAYSRNANGVQIGYMLMTLEGEVNGAQIGWGAIAGNGAGVKGFQFGVGGAIADYISGVQIGGEMALALSGDVNGVQLGGIASGVNKGTLRGVQLSGVYSGATALKGLQIGSINYVGNDFCGVQLGVVNISLDENKDSNKLQIGLINYMKSAAVKCLPIVNMSF